MRHSARKEAAGADRDSVRFSVLHGHGQCFLCGEKDPWLPGLRFVPDDAGGIRTHFDAHAGLQGYDGILHGGVIAALLDAAMTHCLFHAGIAAVTADLHVRYVRPVPVDVQAEIHAWVLSSKPRLHRMRAEIHCGNSLAAWAEASFAPRPHRADH